MKDNILEIREVISAIASGLRSHIINANKGQCVRYAMDHN